MRSLTARERGLLGAIVSLRIPQLTAVPFTRGGVEVRSEEGPVAVWVSNGLSFELIQPGGTHVVGTFSGYVQAIEKTIDLLRRRRKLAKAA